MTAVVDVGSSDNRDLIELPPGRWDRLAVPEGWEPIADICRHTLDQLLAERAW